MSRYELINITGPDEQTIELDIADGDDLIGLTVNGDAHVDLSIAEAEALIAKLAVKVAQARMA